VLDNVTDVFIPLRVTADQEEIGFDISQHGEAMHETRRPRCVATSRRDCDPSVAARSIPNLRARSIPTRLTILRSLAVNDFTSGKHSNPKPDIEPALTSVMKRDVIGSAGRARDSDNEAGELACHAAHG